MLSPDLQHSLSGVLMRHGDIKQLHDPDVGALLSNLLHDELETPQDSVSHVDTQSELEMQEQEAKEQKEHEQRMSELETSRRAHIAEMEAAKARREADRQKALKDSADRQQAHEELARKNEEFMQRSKARREKAEKQRVATQERQAKTWERASSLLRQVHEDLEVATNGWQNAPFWDDFFHSSSAVARFSQLSFNHIEPSLQAASLMPHHRVLVLEPRGASLADRLAGAIQSQRAHHVEANAYGAESDEGRDLVLELGLLDAMAMTQASDSSEASKLDALRSAATRLATLVKPGGTWISVSAVPPTLRLPLLGRLASSTFALPSTDLNASTGTHSIILPASIANGKGTKGLRGASQVADMLLYGSEDVHFWAYRMKRDSDSTSFNIEEQSTPDGLLDIIRQQRPGTRDDL